MEWEITIHNEKKYMEIVTSGVADANGSKEMAKIIAETMRYNKLTKALIDHRNIISVVGQVTEIYERPKLFRIIGMILGIKIAEIISPDHVEHFDFFETVCRNQGFKFTIFYDKTNALEWLLN